MDRLLRQTLFLFLLAPTAGLIWVLTIWLSSTPRRLHMDSLTDALSAPYSCSDCRIWVLTISLSSTPRRLQMDRHIYALSVPSCSDCSIWVLTILLSSTAETSAHGQIDALSVPSCSDCRTDLGTDNLAEFHTETSANGQTYIRSFCSFLL